MEYMRGRLDGRNLACHRLGLFSGAYQGSTGTDGCVAYLPTLWGKESHWFSQVPWSKLTGPIIFPTPC
jgi:hypothetical protein